MLAIVHSTPVEAEKLLSAMLSAAQVVVVNPATKGVRFGYIQCLSVPQGGAAGTLEVVFREAGAKPDDRSWLLEVPVIRKRY